MTAPEPSVRPERRASTPNATAMVAAVPIVTTAAAEKTLPRSASSRVVTISMGTPA
jgi:hypothetical protein